MTGIREDVDCRGHIGRSPQEKQQIDAERQRSVDCGLYPPHRAVSPSVFLYLFSINVQL